MITVSCAACKGSFKVKPEHAGKRIKCKRCGEAVVVPAAEGAAFIAAWEITRLGQDRFSVDCPYCQAFHEFTEDRFGESLTCRECQEPFHLPEYEEFAGQGTRKLLALLVLLFILAFVAIVFYLVFQ